MKLAVCHLDPWPRFYQIPSLLLRSWLASSLVDLACEACFFLWDIGSKRLLASVPCSALRSLGGSGPQWSLQPVTRLQACAGAEALGGPVPHAHPSRAAGSFKDPWRTGGPIALTPLLNPCSVLGPVPLRHQQCPEQPELGGGRGHPRKALPRMNGSRKYHWLISDTSSKGLGSARQSRTIKMNAALKSISIYDSGYKNWICATFQEYIQGILEPRDFRSHLVH